MNTQQIERTLQKFFNGETNLFEEALLKDFFSKNDVPKHLESLKEYFIMTSNVKNDYLPDDEFDRKIIGIIENKQKSEKNYTRKIYSYLIVGVAASILILTALFNSFDRAVEKFKDTYSDPAIAYQETKNALYMLSKNFNSGIKPARKITKLEKSMEDVNKIRLFKEGIDQARKVSALYETQTKLLINKYQ